MFQFTGFPLPALCVQAGVTPHDGCRVSPFGHPRIEAWSTAPRGFSQSPTSFIGIRRQGIHRWHFIAWNFSSKRCSCSLSNSQGARGRMRIAEAYQTRRRDTPPTEAGGAIAPSKRNRGKTLTFRDRSTRLASTSRVLEEGRTSRCINWVTGSVLSAHTASSGASAP